MLAWLLWIGGRNLDYRATYLSEVTTGALWLAGWWLLFRWEEDGRLRYLASLGACVAGGAITRPLTMLAFAIPAAVVVFRLVIARRAWRDLALLRLVPDRKPYLYDEDRRSLRPLAVADRSLRTYNPLP